MLLIKEMAMSRYFKSMTAVLTAVVMTLLMIPAGAVASEAASTENGNENAVKEVGEQLRASSDAFAFTTKKSKAFLSAEELPSKLDLTHYDSNNDGTPDRSYVTPIKFQNPFGTCWGFAAIAAAETSILGNETLNDPDDPLYSISLDQKGKSDGKDIRL